LLEYQTLFDARGGLYNRANRLYPEARAREAAALLRHLALSPRARWLDVFAGGGYLSERARAEGFPPASVACDGSLAFLLSSELRRCACVASGSELPFADGSFDAVACLAALHHAEDPSAVICELLRVVARGGRVALGDAAADSPTSLLLNAFVDRHTASGHFGRFYSLETLAGFYDAAGAGDIRTERAQILWIFPSHRGAVDFCRNLFGLMPETTDREIAQALEALGARPSGDRYEVPWTMHFISGRRA
jgi:ubiquinone/menaquinone biosynthesis C-methylase UbiE